MNREDHRSHDALPAGTVLREYVIEEELGSGGFGIVYRARHEDTGGLVAMKEYVPREFAVRDGTTVHPRSGASVGDYESGLQRFVREAGELERFQNLPGVVSVRGFFRANGTAYLVMNYEDGLPLSAFLEQREASGEPFEEDNVLAVVLPLLEALSVVHRAGVLHRDIKPGNIFLRRENALLGRPAEPVLIDFGAAKQNYLSQSRSGAPYTPGYAAFEQTSSMGEMGPWTDIYALGATMWRMVAGGNTAHVETHGANPVDVLARNYALVRGEPDPMPSAVALGSGRFAPHVLAAIDRCLALYPEERPRNCEELLGLLGGATDAVSAESDVGRGGADIAGDRDGEAPADGGADGPDASPVGKAPVVRRSRSGAIWGLVAALVAVVVLFAYLSGGSGLEFPRIEPGSRSAEDSESPGPVRRAGEEFRERLSGGDEGPEMVVIPAGTFRMGCLSDDDACDDDEKPVHEVRIPQPVALSKHEVTRGDFARFVEATGHSSGNACRTYEGGKWEERSGRNWRSPALEQSDAHPVVCVNWHDAKAYVAWLSRETGHAYRLPSESEWEYAARAGSQTKYHFGNLQAQLCRWGNGSDLTAKDRYSGWRANSCRDGYVHTAPVGSFGPSPFGLHDMHGNVWEWVEDCWNGSYAGAPSDGSAWTRGECARRVLRGGSWYFYPRYLRSAIRVRSTTSNRNNYIGFRVARTLTP